MSLRKKIHKIHKSFKYLYESENWGQMGAGRF